MELTSVDPLVRDLFDEVATLPLEQRLEACQTALTAMRHYGARLRGATVYRLREQGLTTDEVAELAGVTRLTISQWTKEYEETTGLPRVRKRKPAITSYVTL